MGDESDDDGAPRRGGRVRAAPVRYRAQQELECGPTGRPTADERRRAADCIEAMLHLKLLRTKGAAVTTNTIALALAWRDDRPSFDARSSSDSFPSQRASNASNPLRPMPNRAAKHDSLCPAGRDRSILSPAGGRLAAGLSLIGLPSLESHRQVPSPHRRRKALRHRRELDEAQRHRHRRRHCRRTRPTDGAIFTTFATAAIFATAALQVRLAQSCSLYGLLVPTRHCWCHPCDAYTSPAASSAAEHTVDPPLREAA